MIPPELVQRVRDGDRRALARAITMIESGEDLEIEDGGVGPKVIGVTGPPGVGKSTLVNAMLKVLRDRRHTVGVLAVDPSSPLTGGALLGDRIRMQDHVSDDGVFIRSMATRGHLGGLSPATATVLSLLAIAGFDRLLVETVGVGQSEVEVMNLVDLVVLVLAPGWGDQIQADKAGIVEIADLFVINKGDRPGVEALHRALTEVAGTSGEARPILVTTATDHSGVTELVDRIDAFSLT